MRYRLRLLAVETFAAAWFCAGMALAARLLPKEPHV